MLLAIASVSRALAALPGERAPGALGATGGSADGALIAGAAVLLALGAALYLGTRSTGARFERWRTAGQDSKR